MSKRMNNDYGRARSSVQTLQPVGSGPDPKTK